MKTLDEVYHIIVSNDDMKEKIMNLASKEELLEFLKSLGADESISAEEVDSYLKARQSQKRELDDDDLEMIAGGKDDIDPGKIAMSVFSFGIVCTISNI